MLFVIMLGFLSRAGDVSTGPHGGEILETDSHKFEVTIDPKKKSVSVFTLRAAKKPPKNMTLTLFQDPETGATIDLKAVDYNTAPQLPSYSGRLGPGSESFMGMELRFELSSKAIKVLKSAPNIRHNSEGK